VHKFIPSGDVRVGVQKLPDDDVEDGEDDRFRQEATDDDDDGEVRWYHPECIAAHLGAAHIADARDMGGYATLGAAMQRKLRLVLPGQRRAATSKASVTNSVGRAWLEMRGHERHLLVLDVTIAPRAAEVTAARFFEEHGGFYHTGRHVWLFDGAGQAVLSMLGLDTVRLGNSPCSATIIDLSSRIAHHS
jgi:hypothetical protein